jgi:hypothetical protein
MNAVIELRARLIHELEVSLVYQCSRIERRAVAQRGEMPVRYLAQLVVHQRNESVDLLPIASPEVTRDVDPIRTDTHVPRSSVIRLCRAVDENVGRAGALSFYLVMDTSTAP